MKIFNHLLASLALISLFGGCAKSCSKKSAPQESVLRIGTNPTLPPFESVDKKGNLIGFDIDLGHAIASDLGLRAEFRQFEFDALILGLQNEQIDIILSGLSTTPSRLKEIAMEPYQGDALKKISFVFWENIPPNITSFSDIAKVAKDLNSSVTVQAGHFLQDFLISEGIPIKPLADPPDQILDIRYKKSLAAVLDNANAQALAQKHHLLKVIALDLPKEKWDLGNGIGIKKDRLKLISDIKKTIKKFKLDGTIERLEAKWIRQDI